MVQVPRLLGGSYGFGTSTFGVSEFLVPIGVLTVIFGYLSGRLAPRTGLRNLFLVGTLLTGLGLALTAFFHQSTWQVVAADCLIGVGIGLDLATAPNLVIGAVPPEKQATMASMVNVPQSILSSLAGQLVFVILGGHVSRVFGGVAFYTNSGYVVVFVVGACAALASFLVSLAIPHGRAPRHASGG